MEEIYCFGGNPLDRASERRRDTLWIQSLLDDPAARIARGATLVFLGLDDRRPYFAIDGGPAEAAAAGQPGPVDARTLAPLLAGGEAAILAEARSLIDWHARHRFCAQCGSATRVESAGWVRRCPEC